MSRALVLTLSAAALLLSGCWEIPEGDEPAIPPNIVFILIDDLGWPDIASYGHAFHETPNIDRLAREGMRFTDAYAAAPVCSPTRASIAAGQYPARIGLTDFIPGHWRPFEELIVPTNRTQHLPDEMPTYAVPLREAGYKTGYFGKWHLGTSPERAPTERGFDEGFVHRGWGHFKLGDKLYPPQPVDSTDYLVDVLTDSGIDFIKRNRDEPFLLTVSHFAVHIPLEAKPETIEHFENKPKPAQGVNHPIYAAMIADVDASVGRILDALEEEGLDETTMVVLFSDNGGLKERFDKADGVVVSTNDPLRDEKGTLYEGGIRVPLVVRWPGFVEPGSESDFVTSSVDLYPTFLDVAGASADSNHVLDGVSLLPALEGSVTRREQPIFFHYPHYHHSRPAGAVRFDNWKMIEFYDTGQVELYNLSADIGESFDVSTSVSETADNLLAQLRAWRVEVGAEMPTQNPAFNPARRGEWGRHPSRGGG